LVRESLGGFLLRMGNYAGAAELFRNDLDRNKRSGRSLFGLMESLKAQKKNSAAAQREFETAWKNADTKLTIADL
jgi:TolA-binding protein